MSKFMRKAKVTAAEVSIMEVLSSSHSTLGVCTRSRALALQRSLATHDGETHDGKNHDGATHDGETSSSSSSSYLQLRTRRVLHKSSGSAVSGENGVAGRYSSSDHKEYSHLGCRRRMVVVEVEAECGGLAHPSVPTSHEMEEFFAEAEQQQLEKFTSKYNFDLVNDCPLPGRYEWAIVTRSTEGGSRK